MEVTIIYRQFYSQLLTFIRSKIRSKEDAEDILQNVFIRVSTNINQLSDNQKLKAWLFTITRNAVIDYYRSSSVKKRLTPMVSLNEDIFEEEDLDSLKGLDQCLTSMISLLPEEYREVIISSEINGVKQNELADQYGIAHSSMRSRIQRGRERLKQLFYNCCHISTDKSGNVLQAESRSGCSGPCDPCSEK